MKSINKMKKLLISGIMGFFLLLSTNNFSAAQTKVFTLDEAVNQALKNNRDVKVSAMNIRKADAAVSEAFGYALPSIDVSANFMRFVEKPKTPFPDFAALLGNATYDILFDENVLPRDDSKFKTVETSLQSFVQTNSYETKVQVTQTLFNSAVFRGIGASQIYLNLSKEEYNRTISSTILNVQKAFYGVLLTKKLNEITKASYNNAEENLRNVRALHTQGFVSEFDLLQAEVRVENIRPTVLQMENTLKNVKDGLKIILGLNINEEIDAEGDLKYIEEIIPEVTEAINEALKSNYSLKSLDLKKQVDEEFTALYKAEYWPSLYAFGNYSYAGSADKYNFQNYKSSVIGLTFSMNIFQGRQSAARVEQSQLEVKKTEEQFRQLKDFIISQVKSKLLEIKRVKDIVAAQDRNVTVAEKAYSISVVRYKEGTGNQLEVQNADIALQQARTNRLQSVYDYIVAKSELDELLGKINTNYKNHLKEID